VPATGLAAGIIIDAIIIRGVLAPALVVLLSRLNGWLPAPAARLLHVTPLTAGVPAASNPQQHQPA
jgi:RND superfamily putative drug exporter